MDGLYTRFLLPFEDRIFKTIVGNHWMKLGDQEQYAPKVVEWDSYKSRGEKPRLKFLIVTPSLNQGEFLERTIQTVVGQKYPNFSYVVMDGGSSDASIDILESYASKGVLNYQSRIDGGQADAINRGFAEKEHELGDDDIMAWINSDDLFAPNSLSIVSEYFQKHPNVDVVYGHRILVNSFDMEVGRWVLPHHCPECNKWVYYVPQETLFWRKRIWEKVSGLDPSFHYALDWDLTLRFQEAGGVFARIPYFLGAFRLHDEQKTNVMKSCHGSREIESIRRRFMAEGDYGPMMGKSFRKTLLLGSMYSILIELGIRL